MHLVIDKVSKLQHIDIAAEHRIDERFTRSTVPQDRLRRLRDPGFFKLVLDLLDCGRLEHRVEYH